MRSKRLPLGLAKTKKRRLFKQLLIIGLSLFVCLSQMSLSPLGRAYADGNSNTTSTAFVDSVKLMTGNLQSGTEVSTTNPITQGETVNLEYNWSKKADQSFTSGQTMTFKIPDAFKVDQDVTEKYITDNNTVKTSDGQTTIGTLAVATSDAAQNANTVTVTWNDQASSLSSGATGTIIIPVTYNDSITADGTKAIPFDLGNNQTTTVNVALKADASSSPSSSDASSSTAASSSSSTGASDSSSSAVTSDKSSSSDGSSNDGSSSSTSTSAASSSAAGSSTQQAEADSGSSSAGEQSTSTTSNSGTSTSSEVSSFKMPMLRSAAVESTSPTGIAALKPDIVLADPDDLGSDGKPTPYSTDHPATPDSSVEIEYTWNVPDNVAETINAGDTLSFKLPDIFSIPANQAPLSGELDQNQNGATVNYGSFVVDANGNVTMTFTGAVKEHMNVSFGMNVEAQIDKSNLGNTTTQVINFPIYQQTEQQTMYFQPGFSDPITKKFDSFDTTHNPKKVTWTINVNLNQQDLSNAQVVEDLASEGLTYDSVKIYPLSVNSVTGQVGNVDTANPLSENDSSPDASQGTYSVDPTTGTVTLGHTTGAYELVYTTTIDSDQIPDNGGQIKLNNTATLKDGNTTLGTGSDSANPSYGNLITKTYIGQDPNNSQVTQWQIQYNYGEKDIPSSKNSITDAFDTSKFFYDNVKIEKVTWDSTGNASYTDVTSDYTPVPTSTGFTIDFGNDSSAYLVTYDLKVKPGAVYIDQDTPVNNTATTGDGTSSKPPLPGEVNQQSLIKSASNIDYQKKTVDWTLMVNEDGYPLNNWTINDTFSYPLSNLTNFHVWTVTKSVDSSTGAVTWTKGLEVTNGFTMSPKDKNGDPGFQLSPNPGNYNPTNGTFMITYTTDFNGYTSTNDAGNITSISNNSILDWYESQTPTATKHETTASGSITPNSPTQANGYKTDSGYNPVNQSVTWKIYTNYNEEPLNNAYISDPIPSGMVFDSNVPVTVYKYDINSDGSVANETPIAQYYVSSDGTVTNGTPNSSEFTVTLSPSSGNQTLNVAYNVPANDTSQYMVSFATDLRGQVVQNSYTNNAIFKNGSYPDRQLSDSVKPTNGGKWIGKYGTQDGKNEDWALEVNKSLSVIDPGATITDTSSSGQIVNADSFKIYPAKIQNGVVQTDSSGHLVPDTANPLTKDVDYTVNVPQPDKNGQQIFTITFNNKMDDTTAYIVQYSSQINIGKTTGSVTNSASFSGNNSQVTQSTSNVSESVKNLSAGGWAIGNLGSLTFQKTGVGSIAIPKVTFELWSGDNSTLLRTGTTGNNGDVTFGGLVLGSGNEYILKEISAPEGYLLNAPQTIDTSNYPNGNTSANAIGVQDNQNQLVVQKVVNSGDSTSGTEFQLYKENLAGQFVTLGENNGIIPVDSSGKLTLNGLAQGSYYLTEYQPPTGYMSNPDHINFDVNSQNQIVDSQGNEITAPVDFTDYQGAVTLTKQDTSGQTVKEAGAVFSLQKLNNGSDWTTQTGVDQSKMTTDKNGQFTLSGLAPGTYRFIETQAPAGYLLNGTPTKPFTISDTGSATDEESVVATDSLNSIQLTKTDKNDSSIHLQGAEYSLYDSDNQVVKKDAAGNTLATTWTTGSNGQFTVNGLAPGDYHFVETAAPSGYQLDTTAIPFTVTNKDTQTKTLTATDKLSSVTLTKVDFNDQNSVLVGANFKLEDSSGNLVTKDITGKDLPSTWTTDSNGQFTVNGLPIGSYQFVEIAAPSGYDLDATPIPFKVANTDIETVPVLATDKINAVTLTKEDVNDQNAVLQGAEFQLQDSNGQPVTKDVKGNELNTVWKTNGFGQFTVQGLASGKYQFVETAAPSGYQLDKTPIPFTVTDTDAKTIPITATNKLNAITLTKVDFNDQSAVLQGAEFQLQDSNGHAVATDVTGKTLPTSWTTNSNGQFTVDGLPTGTYQFVETKAPNGYQLDATPIPFTVTNTAVQAIPVTATDKLNSITLTKVDKNDNNIHLQGAVFELQDSNGNAVTTDAAGNQLPVTWTTDANGQFTVTGLAPGSYQFVETKAPANYDLDATPIPFTITNKDTSSQELTATDKLTAGAVQLTKVDKNDTHIHLQGATFKLEDSKGNAVTTDSDGKALPSTWTTDSNGLFTVGNLAPGDYQFIETKAPYGYDLDATPIPFTIAKSQQKAVEITATDSLTPGDVRLTKVDANDKNAVLKGAVFKLEDSKGNTLKTGLTTDSNGQFIVKGLAPGNYYFVETTAPTGYQLDDTPIPFTIEKAQAHAVEITATDKSKPIVLKGKPGVTYNIVDNDGHIIRRGVMADEQGNVIVKGLKPGSYHLVRAVEAYTSSPVSKNLPTTGDTNDIIGVGAGVVMLLVGGLLAFLARRRND